MYLALCRRKWRDIYNNVIRNSVSIKCKKFLNYLKTLASSEVFCSLELFNLSEYVQMYTALFNEPGL
jgi:hypothetical protein